MVAAGTRAVAEKLRHTLADVDAAALVADHGIAGVDGLAVSCAHGRDRGERRLADLGAAEIAGHDAGAAPEHADRVEASDAFADVLRLERPAAPAGIAGVAGELHGINRPHLAAEPLQSEYDGGIADMAVDDMGLDRENRAPWPKSDTICATASKLAAGGWRLRH